jgi:hypothetical protein
MLIDVASVEPTGGRVVVVNVGAGSDNLLSTVSNRLFSVPRVAATRANVISPNRPIIPSIISIRLSIDSAIFINNLYYLKDEFTFFMRSLQLQTIFFYIEY